jgi:hypothetical protein
MEKQKMKNKSNLIGYSKELEKKTNKLIEQLKDNKSEENINTLPSRRRDNNKTTLKIRLNTVLNSKDIETIRELIEDTLGVEIIGISEV